MPRDADVREAVVVYLNVSILALPYIDTAQLKFTADFYLNLRWYDLRVNLQVQKILFISWVSSDIFSHLLQDLNEITILNSLSIEDVDSIWKPQLTFVNALGPYQTEYDDQVHTFV